MRQVSTVHEWMWPKKFVTLLGSEVNINTEWVRGSCNLMRRYVVSESVRITTSRAVCTCDPR